MTGPMLVDEGGAQRLRVRFVARAGGGDTILMRFDDPAPCDAVFGPGDGNPDAAAGLDVVLVPAGETKRGLAEWLGDAGRGAPLYVKYRGVELVWWPSRAALQCDPEQVDALLAAVVDFTYYEGELWRIEREIAAAWAELEEDKALAFDVTAADLQRADAVGGRMGKTFARRIRLARMETRLYAPDKTITAAAQKLGEEMRERAGLEARVEIVDGQIEVFEHVYEMASQRMGEFRAARQGQIIEWIIIVLLAAEVLLMLAQGVGRVHI